LAQAVSRAFKDNPETVKKVEAAAKEKQIKQQIYDLW